MKNKMLLAGSGFFAVVSSAFATSTSASTLTVPNSIDIASVLEAAGVVIVAVTGLWAAKKAIAMFNKG